MILDYFSSFDENINSLCIGIFRPISVQETHGGDEVGIWAAGPLAHLVHATHQQSYVGEQCNRLTNKENPFGDFCFHFHKEKFVGHFQITGVKK